MGSESERKLPIRAAAARYRVSARTLRFYEEAGLLHSSRGANAKYREYDAAELRRLEMILLLRRLSFTIREIAAMLCGDARPLDLLAGKIRDSDARLVEVRQTNQLLHRLYGELSAKSADSIDSIRISDVVEQFVYITKQTERLVPHMAEEKNRYSVAIGRDIVARVVDESDGDLVGKIKALRAECERIGVPLPQTTRVYDGDEADGITPTQVRIVWDGNVVYYADADGTDCAERIIAKLRERARASTDASASL